MNILIIAKRIITQILRDKRTIMLLFVAPLLLLTLLHYIFQTVDDSKVSVGVYHIPNALSQQLRDSKINIIKVSSPDEIKQHIENKNLHAIIIKEGENIEIYYENIDPSKTMRIKQSIQAYKIENKFSKTQIVIKEMEANFNKVKAQLDQLNKQIEKLGPLLKRVGVDMPKQEKVKVKKNDDKKIHTHYVYGNKNSNYFDMLNPVLIAFFVFFFTFLISGITLLKERTTGTLAKLLTTPIKRYEIVLGYLSGFSLFAIVQTILLVVYAIYILKIHVEGSHLLLILNNIILAFVALGLGLFISTFAKSEFQMIQFIPLIIVPQLLFSGIIPIETMHKPLQWLSYFMPLRYGADNLQRIMIKGQTHELLMNNIILLGFLFILIMANIFILKRYRNI